MKYNVIVFLMFLFFYGCERPTGYNKTDSGIPPAVPSSPVVFSAYDGTVLIYWHNNSEPDLKGYNVYRSIDSVNFTFIGFTPVNSFYDDSLNYNTKYYYRITSLDIWNNESLPSTIISAEPVNKYAPYTPIGLSVNARNWEGNKSVYFSWNPNPESDIAGYKIYRASVPGFTADTNSYIGFTNKLNFSDTLNLKLYSQYYYSIKAVDNGGLISKASGEVNDEIFGIPHIIYPEDNAETPYFAQFMINSINKPAKYEIIVQDNQYFGEVWSTSFNSNPTNDTLYVPFNANYIYPNKYYYWRVATYSANGSGPNSISKLYKFIIKQ